MKEAFVFEVGKCYEHNTGKRIHIVAEAELDIYFSPCLIAETDSGSIIPVGKSEENTVNYHEITREEWLNTFKSGFVSEVEAEYGNGWIPCNRADHPYDGQRVLACINTRIATHEIIITDYNGEIYWFDGTISAWMPLPSPYKPTTD